MIAAPQKCWLVAIAFLLAQSLADIARQEAERRRTLDQQGIEAKVVDGAVQNGNLTLSTGPSSAPSKKTSKASGSAKEQASLRSIRTALQKLDRSIRQNEERLELRRARLQSERWAIPRNGRLSNRNSAETAQNRLQQEIEELQIKLNELRQERSEIYESGKRAGFLPGELDGKGIVP